MIGLLVFFFIIMVLFTCAAMHDSRHLKRRTYMQETQPQRVIR